MQDDDPTALTPAEAIRIAIGASHLIRPPLHAFARPSGDAELEFIVVEFAEAIGAPDVARATAKVTTRANRGDFTRSARGTWWALLERINSDRAAATADVRGA